MRNGNPAVKCICWLGDLTRAPTWSGCHTGSTGSSMLGGGPTSAVGPVSTGGLASPEPDEGLGCVEAPLHPTRAKDRKLKRATMKLEASDIAATYRLAPPCTVVALRLTAAEILGRELRRAWVSSPARPANCPDAYVTRTGCSTS